MRFRRRMTLGALMTQAQFQQQANAAEHDAVATGGTTLIQDNGGTVTISSSGTPSSIAQQVAATAALTAAEQTAANDLATDAYGIQSMHANTSLASNSTPYLAPGVTDGGAVGAAPTYIALPQYPKAKGSQNPGTFPYNNPPPHWTTNCKWWTGQTLLNVGAPKYANDPWEYLRSGLVDSNITMLTNWITWFLAEVGKPPTTVYASAQVWAQALASVNFSQAKFIATSEGAVFLPFSYADLTAMQTATKGYEYGYDAATLATYLSNWVAQVLPDVSQFPIAGRLDPASATPYGANYLPAIYRTGSTFLSQVAPYLPVLTIAAAGALGVILAAGSGIGAAASDASTAADVTDAAVADSLSVPADVGSEVSAAASDVVLPDVIVSATPVAADAGATTALTAVAAAGATVPTVTSSASSTADTSDTTDDESTLPEVDVTATTEPPAPDLSVSAPDIAAAAAADNTPINYASSSQNTGPSTSQELSAASALAKLLGFGSSAPTSAAGDGSASGDGITGTGSETLGDFLGSLTSNDWLLILAAGATGLYFVHKSRPKRKRAHA